MVISIVDKNNDTNIDLNELLKNQVMDSKTVLEKYTYSNAAKLFYDVLKSM